MSRRKPFASENQSKDYEFLGNVPGPVIDFEESFADIGSRSRLEQMRELGSYPRFVLIVGFAIFMLLAGRLYELTIREHEQMRAIAEGNRLRIEYLNAPRGTIFDRNREILATSKPAAELVLLPLDLPSNSSERDAVIGKVASIVNISQEEIISLIPDSRVPVFESVLVRQTLTRDQALVLQEREGELPGFRVSSTPIRDYKHSPEAYSHLLGYVGKLNAKEYEQMAREGYLYNDTTGKTGLEQSYEPYLRGKFGERQVEVDARGTVEKIFGSTEPLAGSDIVLNIDAGLQDELYSNLTARLRGLGRRKAAAMAMEPSTGRMLAFISLPGFNNNQFAEGITTEDYARLAYDRDQPLFNRAISGVYPPGSTVKPMVAIAALEEKIITPETTIKDEGAIVVKNIYGGPDSVFIGYGRRALGVLSIRKAIAVSSDIFFYIVGGGFGPAKIKGLGIDLLAKYYRMFKLDEILGIDIAGEQAGLVPDPEWKQKYFSGDEYSSKWYLGDTYHVSIGQGDLLASPLHVLSWTSAIANGGKLFRPFIVDHVESGGVLIKQKKPEMIGEITANEANIRVVQEGMREAVLSGTATSLQRLPISSAAKTGTAQFDAKNAARSHAWFTAYAPFENPQIAITVLIEDGGEGGVNAMPVVRDTLNWWASNRLNKFTVY